MNTFPPVPIPAQVHRPARNARQVAVVSDDAAITAIVGLLIARSGHTPADLADALGVKYQSLAQYRDGYRTNPSIRWLSRLAHVCGAKIYIEFPE